MEMKDKDINAATVLDVHRKTMDIWKQLAGMPHYEVGGLIAFLASIYLACYPRANRGAIYNRIGDSIQTMIDRIKGEILRQGGTSLDEHDWQVEFSDQASDAMLTDPELRAAVNEMTAKVRQALEGVDMTNREAVEAAMNALGAEKVDRDDIDEMREPRRKPN